MRFVPAYILILACSTILTSGHCAGPLGSLDTSPGQPAPDWKRSISLEQHHGRTRQLPQQTYGVIE